MNRLQKKCIFASVGAHLLLLGVLFIGPAFRSSNNEKPQDLQVINFVPLKTVDAAVMGGGTPQPHSQPSPPTAPPKLPPPLPQPAPKKAPPPEPKPKKTKAVKETRRPRREHSVEKRVKKRPAKTVHKSRHRIVVNKHLITRHSAAREAARRRAEEARSREVAQAREKALHAIGQTVTGLQHHLSGTTTIKLTGPGGGGVPYANWLQSVKSIYANAWVVPDSVTDDSLTAVVSVTIGRDGRVIASRLISGSGNGLVDQSVRATLERVHQTAPLPDNAKKDRRTVTIYFNVKSKLLG